MPNKVIEKKTVGIIRNPLCIVCQKCIGVYRKSYQRDMKIDIAYTKSDRPRRVTMNFPLTFQTSFSSFKKVPYAPSRYSYIHDLHHA